MLVKYIEKVIFASKWILIFFYFKLFFTLLNLLYVFVVEGHLTSDVLMNTLEDVDIVMIANLVKMIITGSYNSFVSKDHSETTEKVSSGLLKVKMSTSIMGVSSIHLLKSFIEASDLHNPLGWEVIHKQLIIHGVFIVGAIALAVIDFLHVKSESFEKHE
jgi:uncharacterized protein (TIGR00645 family)